MSSEPEDVRDALAPITIELYRAFDFGVMMAREYFARFSKDAEPHGFANLVRMHVAWHLEEVAPTLGILFTKMQNNGVLLGFAGFDFRTAKGRNGTLPPPGRSRAKVEFYRQGQLPWMDEDANLLKGLTSLVLLWHVDFSNMLSHLSIACPKGDFDWQDEPKVFWQIDLPHPLDFMRGADEPVVDPDLPDLPLDLTDLPETGTGEQT